MPEGPQRRWWCSDRNCSGEPHDEFRWCRCPCDYLWDNQGAVCSGTTDAMVMRDPERRSDHRHLGCGRPKDAHHTFSCRHARPSQREPLDDWLVWLFSGGRGTGKTRAGAEWVHDQVWNQGKKRIALVARTPADARDVMIYGDSGIMAVSDPHPRPIHEPTKRRLVWPNGAQAFTYSAAAPAQLRGPQHDAAWCFPSGTRILTPFGERPIEELHQGDIVSTRFGPKRVEATGSRLAPVGTVWVGSSRLVGTPEHPVLTSHGWTRLDTLTTADSVVCIGGRTRADIWRPRSKDAPSFSTDGCGSGAANVASTWEPAGVDRVYNLTVADVHEFVANGIVVHNCDETAAWFDARKGDVLDTSWNNLMLGLRLGHNPRCFVTTTPKRVRLIRELMERKSTSITTDTTYANLMNLAPSFEEQVVASYEGTRIGRQELMGELLTDVDGALWTLENIDGLRVELDRG